MNFIHEDQETEFLSLENSSPNSYIEILIPDVRVQEGEAFEWWLGHRSGALMNCP